jgi:tetratricopeptide (TPR) repeat protein
MRFFLFLITVPSLLFLTCSDSFVAGKSDFKKGLQALEAGRPDDAREIFESISSEHPDSPYGWYGQSLYYDKEGFTYEAYDANYKAIEASSEFLPALLLNSKLSLDIERPDLAFASIVLYQKHGGDEKTAAVKEAEILLAAGKIEDAGNTLKKALGKYSDDPLLKMMRAHYYLHTGDFIKGLQDCKDVTSREIEDANVLEEAGHFYKTLGLADSADSYYKKALSASSGDPYFKADIIEGYAELGYFHQAKNLLKEFLSGVGETHRYYLLGSHIYDRMGRPRNALQEYGYIVSQHHLSPTVMVNLAMARHRTGDKLGSGQYFFSAYAYVTHNSFPPPVNSSVLLRQLEMYIEQRRFNEAGPAMRLAMDTIPEDFRSLLSAAIVFHVIGARDKYDQIMPELQKAARSGSFNLARLGTFFRKIDSLRTAREIYNEVLGIDRLNNEAILGEVEILKKKNQLQEALAFLDRLDEYQSYRPEIFEVKMKLYDQIGTPSSAIAFAERLIEIAKKDIERYKTAVRLAFEAGDEKKAGVLCRMCIENNPDNPEAFTIYGKYLFNSGDYAGVDQQLSKALALDSNHVASLVLMADLDAKRGRIDSAIALYKKALELDQYVGEAYGKLALVMVENGMDAAASGAYAQKAIYYDGTNPRHHSTLGHSYVRMGKYKLARGAFERALKFAPGNPEYSYHAGMASMNAGDPPERARDHLNKAINNGLKGELRREAEKALKKL